MATSKPPDEVGSAASVTHSRGQPPLEPAAENVAQQGTPISVLDTDNQMTSETLGTFCDSYSEFDIEFSSCLVTSSSPKKRKRTPLEAPTAIIKEGAVTTSNHNSSHGTRLDGSGVSISEHDLRATIPKETVSHQPTPSKITGELQADANIISSAVSTGTDEKSSQKCLLKGKSWVCFAFPAALTLRFRYFPRIFVALSLE